VNVMSNRKDQAKHAQAALADRDAPPPLPPRFRPGPAPCPS
jgi:hypothetical protein